MRLPTSPTRSPSGGCESGPQSKALPDEHFQTDRQGPFPNGAESGEETSSELNKHKAQVNSLQIISSAIRKP